MKPATLKQKIVLACVPRAATLILGGLTASWRIGEAGAVSASPASRPSEPKIYAVWHEVALAAGHYRGLRLHALASQSFDGELISRALVQLGWAPPARGSSTRGGSGGTLELQGFLRQGESVLLTVDGPRGPRHVAKPGAVKLGRISGLAVVPVAFVCRPALRLKSWDRMMVPAPFARGLFWFGEELRFTKDGADAAALGRLQRGLEAANRAAARALARSS